MIKKRIKPETENTGATVPAAELADVFMQYCDDVFLELDANFNVVYVSPNVERVLGISIKDVEKDIQNIGKGKYLGDKEITLKSLSEIQIGSSVSHVVGRAHGKSKEVRYYSETVHRVVNGSVEKYIIIISDRTKELLTKQSLEEALTIAKIANRSKSTFIANVSHDLRTPMNTLVGLCTLLQRDINDAEKLNEHIKHLTLTSRHMLTLINDILDMSKIEAGETTLNVSEINVVDLIKEIEAVVTPQAKAKRQSFKITVAVKTEKILGDKSRIKHVLLNLLSNAVKYTDEGGHIELIMQQIARSSRKFMYLQFIVKDDGVGMSEQLVKKIFEPYSRELTQVNDSGSTGLGMAVAKNLIDLMGGTISVESKLGVGSTFAVNFKFPVSRISDSSFWQEQGISRLLIVGENNVDNNSVTWAMRKTEVAISFAKTFKAAATSINKALTEGKGYNVVIYDWIGDDEACLDTLKQLRAEIPEYVPLVVMGDLEGTETGIRASEAGADAFLLKPFTVSNFKECVTNLNMQDREGLVPKSDRHPLEGMKFLAAEDNELNALVLTELLKTVGASCVVKPNGKEALDEFVKSSPKTYNAVLMDIQMPVMDGYEATRQIRKSGHVDCNIPILAMTANAFAEDIKNCIDAGMNAYMLKPIDISKLEENLSVLLNK